MRIYGVNDDAVIIENSGIVAKIPAILPPILLIGIPGREGVIVVFDYGRMYDVWNVQVQRLGEKLPIPWKISVGPSSKDYSIEVQIECEAVTPVYVFQNGSWKPVKS